MKGFLIKNLGRLSILKPLALILGWGTSIAGLALFGVFAGFLLPQKYYGGTGGTLPAGPWLIYLGFFAVSLLGGAVVADPGRSLLSFLVSYAVGGFFTYWILALPGFLEVTPVAAVLVSASLVLTFTALFPFPLVLGILGSLLGVAVSENLS